MPRSRYQSRLYVDPALIPKGYGYAWVREATLQEPDPDNVTMKMVGGWKPVPAERHPDMVPPPMPGYEDSVPTVVRRGGLLLCERPMRDIMADRAEIAAENADIIRDIAWAAPDEQGMVRQDYGSSVGIERVVAQRKQADFKDD